MIFKNRTWKGHKIKRNKFLLIRLPLIIFIEELKMTLVSYPVLFFLALPNRQKFPLVQS